MTRSTDAEFDAAHRGHDEPGAPAPAAAAGPGVNAARERLARADVALRAMHPVPPVPRELSSAALAAELAGSSPAALPLARVSRAARPLALAAGLAMAVSAALWVWTRPGPGLNAAQIHAGYVLNQSPQVVCDTPEKFLAYTEDALGEPITADFLPGLTLVGWRSPDGYAGELGRRRVLLADGPGGEPIVVLFQPAEDGAPVLTGREHLRAHRARFGSIEAYEVSMLDGPVVLGRLSRVDR